MNRTSAPPPLSVAAARRPELTIRQLGSNLCLALACAVCASAFVPAAQAQAREPFQSVEGELLVGFRAGVGQEARLALYRGYGASVIEGIDPGAVVDRIGVPPTTLEWVARELATRPEVSFVEKNAVIPTALLPNDPQYSTQWYLPRIHLPQAWDLTQGSSSVVIAIVDSGVDPHHPDLSGKLVAGFNTVDKTTNTADQYGHGTKMAGVAGARTNNGIGIAGVAGLSPIMPVRVTDRGGRATSASIAKGVVWAVDHGARVVNLSLEGIVNSATIRAASEYAFNRGALVVAPSGNCGCVDEAPETPFILSVAASDESDQIAALSTTGAFVDLSAPGVNIPTTTMYGLFLGDSGTSLASAVVAGVAALMFSVNPALTPAEVTLLLVRTVVDPGGNTRKKGVGHGRVDAFAAVSAAAVYRSESSKDVGVHSRTDITAAKVQ